MDNPSSVVARVCLGSCTLCAHLPSASRRCGVVGTMCLCVCSVCRVVLRDLMTGPPVRRRRRCRCYCSWHIMYLNIHYIVKWWHDYGPSAAAATAVAVVHALHAPTVFKI